MATNKRIATATMAVAKKTPAKKALVAAPAQKATPAAAQAERIKPHKHVLSSNTQNALGILCWSKFAGEADLQGLCTELGVQTQKVQDGDMQPVEGMLYRQAKTLETIFTSLALRAAKQEGLKQFQVTLTLALKAQAQCRATLEALAEIKNPRPVQFVKQANMTTGPQQINNGIAAQSPAGSFQSAPNKLLEADHGQRLDIRAQGKTSRVNQAVEAVAAVHRPSVSRGQGTGCRQRLDRRAAGATAKTDPDGQ